MRVSACACGLRVTGASFIAGRAKSARAGSRRAGANHAMDLLRRVMNHAVACGHIQTNPTRGREAEPPSAVLQGVPLPVVTRMLGHRRPSMTTRYAHVGDGGD